MSSNVVDAIVSGASAQDVAQEIKDTLYSKAAERVDTYREVASAAVFGASEESGEEDEEWLLNSLLTSWNRPLL